VYHQLSFATICFIVAKTKTVLSRKPKEAKNPGKRLWLSFNGVVRRVLLTLFEQSYKGFKKKFFKVCCSAHDPTLLDGFPLYWVEKPRLKKPRSLENLIPCDRETCEFFSMLGAVFDIAKLIKFEFHPGSLKKCIGTSYVFCFAYPVCTYLLLVCLLF